MQQPPHRLPSRGGNIAAHLVGVAMIFMWVWQPVFGQMTTPRGPYLVVLGVAQDAGFPQAGCVRECCEAAFAEPELQRFVTCLGLVDPAGKRSWLFEATPDLPMQLKALSAHVAGLPAGLFLTHAHIGHYTGLMHFGREVMGATGFPVYAMPRMRDFLTQNGPWSQLVELGNIALRPLAADSAVTMTDRIRVTPFRVPHRDEFSETIGFRIEGPVKSAIFIPDIDKWEKWERDIGEMIHNVDYAFVDGTFFAEGELPGRNMAEIPHPFISETMERLANLPENERGKVIFIHFNHTNPALREDSEAARIIREKGFRVATEGMVIPL